MPRWLIRLWPWLAGAVLSAGYVLGRREARRHLRELGDRERAAAGVIVSTDPSPPDEISLDAVMVAGSCVVAPDALRRTIGYWRNRIGSRRAVSDEVLLGRARREALLRLREAAAGLGADRVAGVRIETLSLAEFDAPGPVEVFAVGMALLPRHRP